MQVRSVVIALALVASAVSAARAEETTASDVTLNGYYRLRGLFLRDPDLDPKTQPNAERYFQHRIRLAPHVFVNEYVSLHAQADAFDDQLLGANPGNVLSQSTEDRSANIVLKRAYGEVKTTVGVFRAGRMGSNWGKGLLSNDGEGFRNEFGDAHGGDTYDRILFATKPLGKDGPLTTALIYDKIIESEYAGAPTAARLKGDVDEFGLVVHYKKDWLTAGVYGIYRTQSKTSTTALIPDVYVAVETEHFHADLEAVAINGSTSGVTGFFVPGQVIQGKKVAKFTFAQPKTDINMLGGAAEAGYRPIKSLDLALEAGYASGDKPGSDAFDDGELSSFSFDADYNVGLIMFEYANRVRTQRELEAAYKKFRTDTPRLGGKNLTEVCAQMCVNNTDFATAALAQEDFLASTATAFLPSNGAVKNAFYLFPKVRFQPVEELKMIGGVLWAKAPEAISTRQTRDLAATDYITETDLRFNYGVEFDYGIEYQYTENFGLGLQAGYFHPGAVFERENGDPAADQYAIQPRFTVTF